MRTGVVIGQLFTNCKPSWLSYQSARKLAPEERAKASELGEILRRVYRAAFSIASYKGSLVLLE
jgi:hypothetical protein